MNFQSKLPGVGTNIFTIMSQLANEHAAINLGQGFPDFNPDAELMDLVTAAMKDGHNQYPPMAGTLELRQRIAETVTSLYGHSYNPEREVTVTSGASEALMASILAFVHNGDEVIIIEPFYDLYIPAIELAGGIPVVVPMQAPVDASEAYYIDWERVQQAVSAKTRMLIINFPHNPTGITLKESDLDSLENIVAETGILLLSDEVYEHIVFDGEKHLSVSGREGLAANAIVVSSFGKTYNATGWKVGYCCAPEAMSLEIRKVHQFIVFTVTTPMQVALGHYMKNPSSYQNLSSFYQKKRDQLREGLRSSRFTPLNSEGTFFLLASYEGISDLPEAEFAKLATISHGVGVIPVSAFYRNPKLPTSNHKLVRFCFAKRSETLDAAIEKLSRI